MATAPNLKLVSGFWPNIPTSSPTDFMSALDLWGDMPSPDMILRPTSILKSQAELLEPKTSGILRAEVRPCKHSPKPDSRYLPPDEELCILGRAVVTAVPIVRLSFDVGIYPVKVVDVIGNKETVCTSEHEFIDELGGILGSEHVRHRIASFLRESIPHKP